MSVNAVAIIIGLVAASSPIARLQAQAAADTAKHDTTRTLEVVRVEATRTRRRYARLRTSTAMRTETPLRDTPQAITVVTHELIADQAMQGMTDVARYAPGITMASGEGHRDQPTIRGNNTTADFFVDGVRDDAQYMRDLYNVDRVEVLKGADAMIFGRGGGGGVINRVTRQAEWSPVRTLTLESGSYAHGRGMLDLGGAFRAIGARAAGRVTSMYEQSRTFRDAGNLTRFGINPTLALMATENTMVRLGYERFEDRRLVDRGVPSYQGRPSPAPITTFFGNPSINNAETRVDLATASVEHHIAGGLTLRNRVTLGNYDHFYQNTYPGAVDASGSTVILSAYNHAIPRRNLIDVLDATYALNTGPLRHTLLVGADVAHQHSSQLRRTGYYDDTTAALRVPLGAPTVTTPVTFRQSATDADNSMLTRDVAVYAQDQIELSSSWMAVVGIRDERFDARYHNNRTDQELGRVDRLISPRAGLVYKPVAALSFYSSYGVSHLPSAGDQFTSLNVTTATLEPERFTNRELGVKWDVHGDLALTAATYRSDRTNTSAPDPNTPGLVVQTGAQRTTGWELGANGTVVPRWQIAGGLASQRATIVSTTSAARAGATVALVPHTSASLWNRYQVVPALGVGLGVIRQTDMYAAVDNSVVLPGFTRVDAALYLGLRRDLKAQLNVENMLNARYYATTQGNNNIMPGAPRTLRVSLTSSR